MTEIDFSFRYIVGNTRSDIAAYGVIRVQGPTFYFQGPLLSHTDCWNYNHPVFILGWRKEEKPNGKTGFLSNQSALFKQPPWSTTDVFHSHFIGQNLMTRSSFRRAWEIYLILGDNCAQPKIKICSSGRKGERKFCGHTGNIRKIMALKSHSSFAI